MVWTMQSGEKTDEVVVSSLLQPKMSKTKKYVIIGITSVTIAVLVLIGLLVGIYMFTDTFNKIATQSLKTNQNSNQDVTADLTANIVQYDVESNGVKTVYVDDYNSFLRVVKLTKDNDVFCYASFMNGTEKVDLTNIGKTTERVESNDTVNYVRVGAPIPDISFMNKKARNLCQGTSTYWIQKRCEQSKEIQKQKRGTCLYCVYVCPYIYSGGYYYYYCRYVCYYYSCGSVIDIDTGLHTGNYAP